MSGTGEPARSQSQPTTTAGFPGSQRAGRHRKSPTRSKPDQNRGSGQASPPGWEGSRAVAPTPPPHPHLPPGTRTATHCRGTGLLLYPAATEHAVFVPTFLHLSLSYPGVFPVQQQEERSLIQSRKQHLPRTASPTRAGPVLLFLSPTAPFSLVTLFCYYSAHSFLPRGCGPLLLEGCHLHFLKLFSSAPFFSACFSKGN